MNKNTKNKGMALVSALIIITLLAIMSGSILQMAYLSYSRKIVERRNNETFYTAEVAIDTIKASVQNSVASALVDSQNQLEFARMAYSILTKDTTLTEATVTRTTPCPDYLKTFLKNKIMYDDSGNEKTDAAYYNGYSTDETATKIKDGIDPANGGYFDIGNIELNNSEVRIHDVHIIYVNKYGYVAEIKTDIVINAPVYASKIEVPTGSYSMFAGNGAELSAGTNFAYLEQEGNVYVGYYKPTSNDGTATTATTTSMSITSSYPGYGMMSFGGEKVVFNGDVYIKNGNAMFFTGGDGTKTQNVQINGNIYLSEGSAIYLAPNVRLLCKGIYETTDSSDLINHPYHEYTGNSSSSYKTVSQFYPMADYNYIKTNATDLYSKYLANNISAFDVLQKYHKIDSVYNGPDDYDPRAVAVGKNGLKECAVYVLDTTMNTSGFVRAGETQDGKGGDKYHLVTRNVADCYILDHVEADSNGDYTINVYKDGTKGATADAKYMSSDASNFNNWNDTNSTSAWNNQIDTRKMDTELDLEIKTIYNGASYDTEFARVVNIPILNLYKNYTNGNIRDKYFTNYDPLDETSYTEYLWKTYDEDSKSYIYPVKDLLLNVSDSNTLRITSKADDAQKLVDQINWNSIYTSDDKKHKNDPLYGDRVYRVPNDLTYDSSLDLTGLSFSYNNGKGTVTFKANNNYAIIGSSDLNVNNESDNIFYFMISMDNIKVKIPDFYAGLYMSANRVVFSGSDAYAKGISILEAGNKAVAGGLSPSYVNNNGIKDQDNPVRKLLIKLSTCMLGGNNAMWADKGYTLKSNLAGLNTVDSLFNGGIESFWSTTASGGNGGYTSNDGSENFIESDSWNNK